MRRWWLVAALALSVGGAPACTARQRVKLETKVATALVSEAQEREIGRQIHKELDHQGVEYVRDPFVVDYVEDIVARLATEVRREGATDEVHVHVIDDLKIVNAFATPGGHLYVFSGLLLAAGDEAEVAGVLGHELGHIVAKHPARRLALAMGYQALASLALGRDPEEIKQVAASLLGGGVLAAHGRGEENEADQLGIAYLHRAGYDPAGLVRFFKRVREMQGDPPAVLIWLSSHPATGARIDRVREIIRGRGWEGGEEGKDVHQRVQRALRPPAPTRGRPRGS
ncbi:MAG: M48 family metallopeptidase [Pseudomonadota bacterium]|nr:M48 family metallopeptidase [Pseudomonadota bacterium]